MTEFKIGDAVNITIEGVRVTAVHHPVNKLREPYGNPHEITVLLDCALGSVPLRIPHHWPMVTAELAVPADWPPQQGDLWRDCDGELWFYQDNVSGPYFTSASSRFHGAAAQALMNERGPLTRVHREEVPW